MGDDSGDTELQFGADDLIAEAIKNAALAGAHRLWGREYPRSAPGMIREADRYSAAATELLNKWMARQATSAAGPLMRRESPSRPDGDPTT